MTATIHTGDAIEWLRTLPSDSAHLCVTSPPYWRMRDYQVAGQYGLEPTIEAYLARQVAVFREVRRVLRPDAAMWLNIGDRYSSGGRGGRAGDLAPRAAHYSRNAGISGTWQPPPAGFKDKELLGLPWRLALALQADGWWLRSDTIWHKPNAKPESAKDRPGLAHEYVFLLAKSESYYYDWWAVREKASDSERNRRARQSTSTVRHYKLKRADRSFAPAARPIGESGAFRSSIARQKIAATGMRGLRSVWSIATKGFRGEHFATYPVDLAMRCIISGTSEQGCCAWCGAPYVRQFTRTPAACIADSALKAEGIHRIRTKDYEPPRFVGWEKSCACSMDYGATPCTVLDPYTGAGTTALAAAQLGRSFIGAELNPQYAAAARLRISSNSANKKRNETR